MGEIFPYCFCLDQVPAAGPAWWGLLHSAGATLRCNPICTPKTLFPEHKLTGALLEAEGEDPCPTLQ